MRPDFSPMIKGPIRRMSWDWMIRKAILLFLLLGLSMLHYETPLAAGVCTATDSSVFGLLDIDPVEQQKEVWCWAASANVVTNFYKLPDPLSTATPPELYSQCRLYNIGKPTGYDCCPNANRSDNRCLQTGWPDWVFDRLAPVVNHARPPTVDEHGKEYILWEEVKKEVCPNEKPGRPFIYAARPQNGIPHTYVVKGFQEDTASEDEDQRYVLFVDSHIKLGNEELGASPITYDCYHTGWCVGGRYSRVRTYYKIRPSDNTPPPSPTSLRVQ
jgi:hypothetical protein